MGEEQRADRAAGRQLPWREARRQVTYLALTVATLICAAIALSALAVTLQAGRDEARSADLALIVAPAVPPISMADDSFELYRRGYVARIVILGEGQAGLKAQLIERGVPEASLQSDLPASSDTADLRRLARTARAEGAHSALVVTAPTETLRLLKVVRDQGLRGYGAPTPTGGADPLSLLGASVRYWRYVLLGL